jgi:hypothetical protein
LRRIVDVSEEMALEAFCTLCFRGDLTERGKVNLLEDLDRRFPGRGYGDLGHSVRMISLLTPEERMQLIEDSVLALEERNARDKR